jgi:soluble lytic murein transglycosylase-like protein
MRLVEISRGGKPAPKKNYVLVTVTIMAMLVFSAPVSSNTPTSEQWWNSRYTQDLLVQTRRMGRLVEHIANRFPVNKNQARRIVSEAFRQGSAGDLAPELVLAVIAVESTFRPRVVSHAGARGLMQIIPKWHPDTIAEIGGANALFDPNKNIQAGVRILAEYLDAQDGNLRKALLRYNGSHRNPRSPYADKVLGQYENLLVVATLGS